MLPVGSLEANLTCYLPPLPGYRRQHRGCIIPQAVTQSSAPEDGQNNFLKHGADWNY